MTEPIVVKNLSAIEAYDGPHSIEGIRFRPAAAALGVSAWGMNVLEIDAGCEAHPEHDHQKDGQEEVYVILKGSGHVQAGEDSVAFSQGDLVRVPASRTRKIVPGPDGVTVLALGGTPGKAFESTM
ncbi:MAG: cupin domain-containing protein [Nannocystaceae bacterium]